VKNIYPTAVLLLFCPLAIYAQDEIDTDRPDQTETPSIVPAGNFQIESGFVHQQDAKDSRTLTLPTTLWKYGLNDNFEFRLTTEIISNKAGDTTTSGLKPVVAGFKVKLWEEKGIVPKASFITHLTLPKVASKELKASYLAPQLKLLLQNTLGQNVDLGYNLVVQWDGESAEPVYGYTLSPNIALTKNLKLFVEAYGFLPQHAHAEHWADGGFMFLITKYIQIDIAAGYELTSQNNYHRHFETLGISFRV
jgi:hypothetical protein